MSENYTPIEEKRKRPTMLIVLLVLSALSMLFSTFQYLPSLVSGPLNQEELDKQHEQVASTFSKMKDLVGEEGEEEMNEALNYQIEKSTFVNNQIFWQFNLLNLLAIAIGMLSLYYMYHLKKLGFHFYIIYSLLAAFLGFILFPTKFIDSTEILLGVILSAVFVFLYAMQLKHFEPLNERYDEGHHYSN